jgi:hypothetical protein
MKIKPTDIAEQGRGLQNLLAKPLRPGSGPAAIGPGKLDGELFL